MNCFRNLKRKYLYILAFVIPFVAMMVICAIRGVYPFGRNSFMHCDMYHQYVPFLRELWRKLHEGESLASAWNLGIGSDFTSIFAYYLATPTNLLVYFCPEHLIIEFMTFFIILKIGLCGFSFAYYLRERFETTSLIVLGFSTLYAMSGFVAAYNWNPMWLDVIWLAPLVILGLERIVKQGRTGLYTIMLTASIFTNYYLSIMLCLFLVLYYVVLFLTEKVNWKTRLHSIWKFGVSSLLAGGMAAVLLIPVMMAMVATGFDDSSFPKTIEIYFNGLEVIARHFTANPVEIGLDHWPNVFCSVAVFFLFPAYLFCGKVPIAQRIAKGLLAAFMMLSFSVNTLNFIWHGLNYPDSLPARQSFLYIFLMLTMMFEVVMHIKSWKPVWIGLSVLVGCVIMTLCGIFVSTDGFTVGVAAISWVFFGIYAVLACVYFFFHQAREVVLLMAVALLVTESSVNMFETSVDVVQRTYYMTKWTNYQNLLEQIPEEEAEEFYRFDSRCNMTKNDGALAGYKGVSIFSSTTASAMAGFYNDIGMEGGKVSYYADGMTGFTAALLGVRYTFAETEEGEVLYTLAGESGKMKLYKHRYTLPVGFVLTEEEKSSLEHQLIEGGSNGLVTQNEMAQVMVGKKTMYTYELRGSMLEVEQSGHYYAYVPHKIEKINMSPVQGLSEVDENGNVVTEGATETSSDVRKFDDLKRNCILDLGYLEEGETWLFTQESGEEEGQPIDLQIYRLRPEVLEQTVAALGEEPFSVSEYEDGYMSGSITASQDGNLVFSIPKDSGWTVLVDGKVTETEDWLGSMVSVPIESGTHFVELHYRPQGVLFGILVSSCCVSIFLFWMFMQKTKEE
ncbi:MAG: YfhO family protein [Lachnospiraceae bacterium]|nr:YfhO family protein [Lachnospiraceae bacterium]